MGPEKLVSGLRSSTRIFSGLADARPTSELVRTTNTGFTLPPYATPEIATHARYELGRLPDVFDQVASNTGGLAAVIPGGAGYPRGIKHGLRMLAGNLSHAADAYRAGAMPGLLHATFRDANAITGRALGELAGPDPHGARIAVSKLGKASEAAAAVRGANHHTLSGKLALMATALDEAARSLPAARPATGMSTSRGKLLDAAKQARTMANLVSEGAEPLKLEHGMPYLDEVNHAFASTANALANRITP